MDACSGGGNENRFTLQWHVTAKCDQRCKHCYLFDENYKSEIDNELSYEDCVRVLEDYARALKAWKIGGRVNFVGGDPLLRKDFFKIFALAHRMGFELNIIGNPYHITPEIARKLKSLGLNTYQVSLDGLEATHDAFRRKGSFADSLRAIKILNEAGIIASVMFTLSKANWKELLPLVELLEEAGAKRFGFSRVVPIGNGKCFEGMLPSARAYRSFLKKVLARYEELEKKGTQLDLRRKEALFLPLYNELGKFKPEKTKLVMGGCDIGNDALVIAADGTVYPCRRLPIKIGKVPEESIREVFVNSKFLNKFRELKNFKKCSKCELSCYCRGCPAVAYAMTGDPFGADPQCWR